LAKFVCEEDFSNVKAYEGQACTLMFVEHNPAEIAKVVQLGDLWKQGKTGGASHAFKKARAAMKLP
jgi:hypothetical protein